MRVFRISVRDDGGHVMVSGCPSCGSAGTAALLRFHGRRIHVTVFRREFQSCCIFTCTAGPRAIAWCSATYRLDQTPADRTARTLSAWSVTSNATVAALTALWGLLASLTSLRAALAIAGLLLLATPLLLPKR